MSLDRHCTGPQLLLLTATARKEKRRGTVENAHAKKLDKSMRLCERKGGQTSPGIQGKNLVETSAAVHWRAWTKESQQSIRQGSKQGQSRGERSRRLRRASRIDQVFMLSLFYQSQRIQMAFAFLFVAGLPVPPATPKLTSPPKPGMAILLGSWRRIRQLGHAHKMQTHKIFQKKHIKYIIYK